MTAVFDYSLAFELEEKLSAHCFREVPVGSTLNDYFIIDFFAKAWKPTLWNSALDVIRILKQCGLSIMPGRNLATHRHKGKILITLLHSEKRWCDLVLPVCKFFAPSEFVLVGDTSKSGSEQYLDNSIEWRQIAGVVDKRFLFDYLRCAKVWIKIIDEALQARRLSRCYLIHLMYIIFVQCRRIATYQTFLSLLRPSAVLTEYDRNANAACLILAAQQMGIPTCTMMHGVINPPYGYTPLLADIAFCWGEQQREQMIMLGTDPSRLSVTGCVRLSGSLSSSVKDARNKMGIAVDKPVVLLASNPIQPEYRRMLVRAFCDALAQLVQITAVVRLHPSETLDFYAPEISKYPTIRFMANNELAVDEALAATDIVVCHDSGFGNDALVAGRLVVVLDALPVTLANGNVLVEKAGCPKAQSSAQLSNVIGTIIADNQLAQELHSMADEYVRYFCHAFGSKAAENCASVIMEEINRSGGPSGLSEAY